MKLGLWMLPVTSNNCSAIFSDDRRLQQLILSFGLVYGYLPSLPSSFLASLSNGRHFQYLTLPFGFVNGCIPSLPAIAQLLLVTAAIFNNSYDLSVWFIDVTIASNNCSANFSNDRHLEYHILYFGFVYGSVSSNLLGWKG